MPNQNGRHVCFEFPFIIRNPVAVVEDKRYAFGSVIGANICCLSRCVRQPHFYIIRSKPFHHLHLLSRRIVACHHQRNIARLWNIGVAV